MVHPRVPSQKLLGHAQNDATLLLCARKECYGYGAQVEQHNDARHGQPGTLALLATRQNAANAIVIVHPAHLLLDAHTIGGPRLAKDARCHQLDDKPDERELEIGGLFGQCGDVQLHLANDVKPFHRLLHLRRLGVGQHLWHIHQARMARVPGAQHVHPFRSVVKTRLV